MWTNYMFQFVLYIVLIIQLGVLLGFYKCNVNINIILVTSQPQSRQSCAHPLRSLALP